MSDRVHQYDGAGIQVRFDTARCIHAGKCVAGSPDVFDPKAKPWVKPDATDVDALARTIAQCPSGALTYERTDGGAPETPDPSVTVRIDPNGPLLVRGDITLNTPDGPARLSRVALCRCGHSKIKPYCDRSHVAANFQHDGKGGQGRIDEIEPVGAGETRAITITPGPNSPLLTRGACEVYDADGALIFCGDKAALCRCGASSNKPFCDGTHAKIGFTG